MSKKMFDKAVEYIDRLAESLGVATEYILEVLIMQKVTEAIVFGSFTLIVSLACIVGAYAFIKKFISVDKNKEDATGWGFGVFFSITGALVFGAIFCVNLIKLINPEYYALKDILDIFK